MAFVERAQENVIAGTDCSPGGRVHPQIARAKLRALRERRGDREQEVVELNARVSVKDERTPVVGARFNVFAIAKGGRFIGVRLTQQLSS